MIKIFSVINRCHDPIPFSSIWLVSPVVQPSVEICYRYDKLCVWVLFFSDLKLKKMTFSFYVAKEGCWLSHLALNWWKIDLSLLLNHLLPLVTTNWFYSPYNNFSHNSGAWYNSPPSVCAFTSMPSQLKTFKMSKNCVITVAGNQKVIQLQKTHVTVCFVGPFLATTVIGLVPWDIDCEREICAHEV